MDSGQQGEGLSGLLYPVLTVTPGVVQEKLVVKHYCWLVMAGADLLGVVHALMHNTFADQVAEAIAVKKDHCQAAAGAHVHNACADQVPVKIWAAHHGCWRIPLLDLEDTSLEVEVPFTVPGDQACLNLDNT
ncbi:hypothetical protein PAXRUDRAFT_28612 [Paxillus rubicundulus Ve08.2h10]|uniref:Uncharacterized protein n=1 Tax=Paxillus rubicundulus Ve08.2h10 TaxID=930991 RepID=A0A0D0C5T5_9AGAM|nr:hypothetical protein PAXRUDRAFT_28612 [Paxillus rubicundulus Ve08.2h10]